MFVVWAYRGQNFGVCYLVSGVLGVDVDDDLGGNEGGAADIANDDDIEVDLDDFEVDLGDHSDLDGRSD